MELRPSQIKTDDPIKRLPPLQRNCYYIAVIMAFVSIFFWVIKILILN